VSEEDGAFGKGVHKAGPVVGLNVDLEEGWCTDLYSLNIPEGCEGRGTVDFEVGAGSVGKEGAEFVTDVSEEPAGVVDRRSAQREGARSEEEGGDVGGEERQQGGRGGQTGGEGRAVVGGRGDRGGSKPRKLSGSNVKDTAVRGVELVADELAGEAAMVGRSSPEARQGAAGGAKPNGRGGAEARRREAARVSVGNGGAVSTGPDKVPAIAGDPEAQGSGSAGQIVGIDAAALVVRRALLGEKGGEMLA